MNGDAMRSHSSLSWSFSTALNKAIQFRLLVVAFSFMTSVTLRFALYILSLFTMALLQTVHVASWHSSTSSFHRRHVPVVRSTSNRFQVYHSCHAAPVTRPACLPQEMENQRRTCSGSARLLNFCRLPRNYNPMRDSIHLRRWCNLWSCLAIASFLLSCHYGVMNYYSNPSSTLVSRY